MLCKHKIEAVYYKIWIMFEYIGKVKEVHVLCNNPIRVEIIYLMVGIVKYLFL